MESQDVARPCAACRLLRRKCTPDRCVLAPYFPPSEPHKFMCVHRVFGACNLIRLLQELREEERGDAVKSLVYEAAARQRDPIYGASGIIYNLHRCISQLRAELASTHAQLFNFITMNMNMNMNMRQIFPSPSPSISLSPSPSPSLSTSTLPQLPSPLSSCSQHSQDYSSEMEIQPQLQISPRTQLQLLQLETALNNNNWSHQDDNMWEHLWK